MTATDIERKFGVQVHRVVGLDGLVEYVVHLDQRTVRAPTLKTLALYLGLILHK